MIATTFRFADEIDRVQRWRRNKERRALYYAGGYGRRVIRSSLKVVPRKKRKNSREVKFRNRGGRVVASSVPGDPPFIHWPNSPLKKLVAFGVDVNRGSVTVGPLLFRPRKGSSRPPPGSTVPAVLEGGGSVTTPGGEQVQILPRPFVGPAMEPSSKKLLEKLRS